MTQHRAIREGNVMKLQRRKHGKPGSTWQPAFAVGVDNDIQAAAVRDAWEKYGLVYENYATPKKNDAHLRKIIMREIRAMKIAIPAHIASFDLLKRQHRQALLSYGSGE